MRIETHTLKVATQGKDDLKDISHDLFGLLKASGMEQGQMTVFVAGSTAGIACIEFEPGVKRDLQDLLARLAPCEATYQHHLTAGDHNGCSHARAGLLGPSLVIPFAGRRLALGTWQQVVLAEFDLRPRERDVVVQLLGE